MTGLSLIPTYAVVKFRDCDPLGYPHIATSSYNVTSDFLTWRYGKSSTFARILQTAISISSGVVDPEGFYN